MPERIARRRPYQAGGRPIRLSVTLTEQERDFLGQLAQERGVTIASLLVQSALHSPWPMTRGDWTDPPDSPWQRYQAGLEKPPKAR